MILYTDDPNLPISKDGGKNGLGQVLECGWKKCYHAFYLIDPATKEMNQACPLCGNDIYLPTFMMKPNANKTV